MMSAKLSDFQPLCLHTQPHLIAADIVAAAIACVPRPSHSEIESDRFDALCSSLAACDGACSTDLLDLPHERPEGVFGQLQCYAVTVMVLAAFRNQQVAIDSRERLQRIIRQQIRVELARQRFRPATAWLIPATPEESTAVHVGSLLMSRSGVATRPWLWAGLPEHGNFSIMSDPAGEPLPTSYSAFDHHRCTGATQFLQLV